MARGNHGDRHTKEKVEREELGRKVNKAIQEDRPYQGTKSDVEEVTGKPPVAERKHDK